MRKTHQQQMVLAAFFIALIILLGLTPIGMIPLPSIKVSILAVPVVIGTLMLGLKWGEVLGLCFGLVSLYNAFTAPSAFAAMLMAQSVPSVIFLCLFPRLLVPLMAHACYKVTQKKLKQPVAVALSAVAGALTNTVFYLGIMLLLFIYFKLDSTPVLAIIGGTGLIAGGLEALCAGVITTPVMTALGKMNKRRERAS